MRNVVVVAIAFLGSLSLLGCSARSGPPLSYLALTRPEGSIRATEHGALKEEHRRGGWYFGNNNFRPAADIEFYLERAHRNAGSDVLRDADVVLGVPFAFDILFFGYNRSTDEVTAGEE